MTTFRPVSQKCYVCGQKSTHQVLTSTNSFGSPDLDLRPSEMQRSTMPLWVTRCPNCGYVAGNLSDKTGVSKKWLQSESYLTCDGIPFRAELAVRFYRHYLISRQDKHTEVAFFALLHAAWSCDDARESANAVRCREMALSLIDELIDTDKDYRNNYLLIKADLLRRAGLFDRLTEEYASLHFDEDIMERILQFQLRKAEEKDDRCYRISDVK